MEESLSELAEIVLLTIAKSKRGSDYTGKIMSLDELEQIFEGTNDIAEILDALSGLKKLKYIRNIEEEDDIYGITPFGERHLSNPFQSKRNNQSKKVGYVPDALEDQILRHFYAKSRGAGSPKKDTAEGISQDFIRHNKGYGRDDVEEAISVLTSKRFFEKETVTTRMPGMQSVYGGRATGSISLKTVYLKLSGDAILYIKNRLNREQTTIILDSTAPYAVRRQLETIFEQAGKGISIADNYIGRKTLDYLLVGTVPVRIITLKPKEPNFTVVLNDFTQQYPSTIEVKIIKNTLHGRFIIADDRYYLLDHSIKNFGEKPSAVIEITDPAIQKTLKKIFDDNWKR